jgi:hypothetical protein
VPYTVDRVRRTALALARDLDKTDSGSVNTLVVELAALFHDMADRELVLSIRVWIFRSSLSVSLLIILVAHDLPCCRQISPQVLTAFELLNSHFRLDSDSLLPPG